MVVSLKCSDLLVELKLRENWLVFSEGKPRSGSGGDERWGALGGVEEGILRCTGMYCMREESSSN